MLTLFDVDILGMRFKFVELVCVDTRLKLFWVDDVVTKPKFELEA